MTSRFSVVLPHRVALRLACLIAVAVALCGMHAFGACGVDGTRMTGMTVMTAGSTPQSYVMGAASGESSRATAQLDAADQGGGMGMSMVEWCLAVILVGLGTVLALRRARSLSSGWLLPRVTGLCESLTWAGRRTPPPLMPQLSILRC